MKRINKKVVIRSPSEFDSDWDYLRHLDSLIDELHLFLMELIIKKKEFQNSKLEKDETELD